MAFLPINPLRTKDGAIAALVPKFGLEKSHPTALTDDDTDALFKNFNVIQDDISISAASTLKIGSIFGGSANFKSRAFYFDAIAYTDKYEEGNVDDKLIFATRWGIGLRIVLNITKIETDFDFNLGSISAAVELGKARAKYEISGIGLGIDGLNIVLENISPLHDFTFGTYDALKKKVIPKLNKYIEDNKTTLTPQPIAVEIIEPISIDVVTTGKSVAFSINQIAKRKSLNEAINIGASEFEIDIIKEVYQSIVGNVPPNDEPSDSAVDRARDWKRDIK
jgi:hypothetical protein